MIEPIIYIALLIIVILIYSFVQARLAEKRRIWIFISNLFIFLIVFFLQYLIISTIQKPETEKDREFQSQVLKLLTQKNIDTSELRDIIVQSRKEIFKESAKEADEWAEQFISEIPKMQRKKATLTETQREISQRNQVKLEVVFTYVIQQFDARALALQKRNTKLYIRKQPFELMTNSDQQKTYIIREVETFEGNKIVLKLHPGTLKNGIIRRYPKVEFYVNTKTAKRFIFAVKKAVSGGLTLVGPEYRLSDVNYTLEEDPLENESFKSKLISNLVKTFEYLYLMV
jgi:hypothetical protein